MTRNRWAVVFNLLAPGSGLIVLRREWFGLAVSVLFAVLAQIGLLGLLILPGTIPPWMTTTCVSAAVFVWLGAQWRLWIWMRVASGPAVGRELAELRLRASHAAESGDYAEAVNILQVALTLNDENLETNLQWARLMTLMGRFGPARQAWHRVLSLDREQQHRRSAVEALEALPQS